MSAYFITGTDTDAGKTWIATQLLLQANAAGFRVLGFKPVAAGAQQGPQGELVNSDALALQAASSICLPYAQVNPYCLAPAIAPHIAAKEAGVSIEPLQIRDAFAALQAQQPDLLLVEGAGGWRVPLDESSYFSDIPHWCQLPVILVVGMKLGCINHALLTIEAIQRDGCKLAGWIANEPVAEMPRFEENLFTLQSAIAAPCLGVFRFAQGFAEAQARVELADLITQKS